MPAAFLLGRFILPGRKLFGGVILTLSTGSLLCFIFLYQTNQPAAYFLMPPRFWEMVSGCLTFLALQTSTAMTARLRVVPPIPVLAAIGRVMLLPLTAAMPATIAVVLLSAIMICCLRDKTTAFRLLTMDTVVFVGLISYSLYLWLWGILCISRWTVGIHWWTVPFQVVLMAILAVTSYHYVESPLRLAQWSHQRWCTLGMGLTSSVIGGVLIMAVDAFCSFLSLDRVFHGMTCATLLEQRAVGEKPDEGCHLLHQVSSLVVERCLPRTTDTTMADQRGSES